MAELGEAGEHQRGGGQRGEVMNELQLLAWGTEARETERIAVGRGHGSKGQMRRTNTL